MAARVCENAAAWVHWIASKALVSLVVAAPRNKLVLKKFLMVICEDSLDGDRLVARNTMAALQVALEKAPALMEPLIATCKDSDWFVH